jgi:hypothetical protein
MRRWRDLIPRLLLVFVTASAPRLLSGQGAEVVVSATAEAGQLHHLRAIAAIGGEAVLATQRVELRASYSRLGGVDGCQSSCFFGDVKLWEVGVGRPFATSARPLSGWVLGIGLGSATEQSYGGKSRFTWSPYLTRTWRPAGAIVLRAEGRVRFLDNELGETFVGSTARFGVGLTP